MLHLVLGWDRGNTVRNIALIGGLCVSVAVAGCAYKAPVVATPSYNVVTSFSEKIPGKWLLAVDATALNTTAKSSSFVCAAHKFPLELAGVYQTSVSQTLKQVFSEVEDIPNPIPADQLASRGATGLIVIRGEEVRPILDVQPGFWSANMRTEIMIVTTATVDKRSGRVFGQTVEGRGVADADAGFACEGGAKSFAEAAGTAVKDSVRRIAEDVGNSERIRGK